MNTNRFLTLLIVNAIEKKDIKDFEMWRKIRDAFAKSSSDAVERYLDYLQLFIICNEDKMNEQFKNALQDFRYEFADVALFHKNIKEAEKTTKWVFDTPVEEFEIYSKKFEITFMTFETH